MFDGNELVLPQAFLFGPAISRTALNRFSLARSIDVAGHFGGVKQGRKNRVTFVFTRLPIAQKIVVRAKNI